MASPTTISFTATGTSASLAVRGEANITISGLTAGTGIVQVQRKFVDDTQWYLVKEYTSDVTEVLDEPEYDVSYRFECTSHTSGTFKCRLSV